MSKEYLLYDKTVKMTFTHGGHRYRVSFLQGEDWSKPRPTTGVTTILNTLNKPALIGWAARLASEKYTELLKKEDDYSVALFNDIQLQAKNAHNEVRDKAGDIGTLIHESIEAYHSEEAVGPVIEDSKSKETVQKAVNAYTDYFETSGLKPLMVEQPVYSRQFDYAGTLDTVFETPSGKKVLNDIKTTKKSKWAPDGVYVENFAQLGGYAQALNEMFGWLPDQLRITNVGKDGEVRVVTNEDFGMTVEDALHYFNAVYTAWYTNKDWEYKFKRS